MGGLQKDQKWTKKRYLKPGSSKQAMACFFVFFQDGKFDFDEFWHLMQVVKDTKLSKFRV